MRIKIFILAAIMLFSGVGVIAGDFTNNGDGTVTDGNTGLMWQQEEAGSMYWVGAIAYCEDLSLAGYSDWRLPNIKELESIVDDSLYGPAIDTNYFPDASASDYWSSTANAVHTGYVWRVRFLDGSVDPSYMSGSDYVRCVRGGQ